MSRSSRMPANLLSGLPSVSLRAVEDPSPDAVAVMASEAPPMVAEAPSALEAPSSSTSSVDDLTQRVTARFNDAQWAALQAECHARRLRHERINVAELLREIVDEWKRSRSAP